MSESRWENRCLYTSEQDHFCEDANELRGSLPATLLFLSLVPQQQMSEISERCQRAEQLLRSATGWEGPVRPWQGDGGRRLQSEQQRPSQQQGSRPPDADAARQSSSTCRQHVPPLAQAWGPLRWQLLVCALSQGSVTVQEVGLWK